MVIKSRELEEKLPTLKDAILTIQVVFIMSSSNILFLG